MLRPLAVLWLLVTATALLLFASVAQGQANAQNRAAAAELALSEDSMQLRYVRFRPQEDLDDPVEAGELGMGLFLNEQRDIVVSANYFVDATRLRMYRMSMMLGPVAYAALLSGENNEAIAIGLGAEVRYRLLRDPQLTIVGRAAYAPDILTFGSADNLWDIVVRAEMPVTDRVAGFGGYRLYEIDLLEGKRELEETVHLGLRYRF